MGYNISFEDSVTGTSDIIVGINNSLDGLPSILSFILIWFFVFFLARARGADAIDSFILTNFITAILGGLFMFLGLFAWYIGMIPFLLLIIGLIVRGYSG